MGTSLGPVMANIIMTELEDKVIKPLMNDGTIKFYCWYVDDTLLVKLQDVSRIHKLLNSFDKNLKFTVDLFENEVPHFSTSKCHRMESRFTGRTLILGYM